MTMTILVEFKENVFKVLQAICEFEQWLYQSNVLPTLMAQDVVLEALTFNYMLRDAKYQFKRQIFHTLTKIDKNESRINIRATTTQLRLWY
jgi:hypothetical protein